YRPTKLAVCTAWGSPFCWTHGAYNMMNLERPEGVEVKFLPGFGRDPARRHMWGIEKAIEWGASHICFLGADQMHPMDILPRLTAHIENGWPAVAAMVPSRGCLKIHGVEKPFSEVAWTWREENQKMATFTLEHLKEVTPADGDLIEIVSIGSGVLMFDIQLLHALEKPWFKEYPADERSWRPAIMDTYFCWRLVTEAGGRILCDTTIKVVHLDVFPIDDTYSERFHDWPEKAELKDFRRDM
ncbi:MAG: hypothetical protein ACXABY_22030, partial [Candidatus Thorarchaeota archaeon]